MKNLLTCDYGLCPPDLRETIISTMKSVGISDRSIGMLIDAGYFTAPAARHHHCARLGGLALHSYNVAKRLCELSRVLGCQWERPDGPIIVGLLHDLVKVSCYRWTGTEFIFQKVGFADEDSGQKIKPSGNHGVVSGLLCDHFDIDLRDDEMVCITAHMGSYGDEFEAKFYDRNVHRGAWYREVLATHMADMIACHVDERGVC